MANLDEIFNVIFLLYLSNEKLGPLFKETCIPFTQECFVPSLIEISILWIWRRRQCIFTILLFSPPWKKVCPWKKVWLLFKQTRISFI